MRLSERFTGTVRGLTSEGSGVVDHPSGRAVFVPGAWPGEQVEAKITQLKSQFALGELLSIIIPHPKRRPAPCPYHGQSAQHCGGCPWQFMAYDEQLAAKQQRVEQAAARLNPALQVLPIQASPTELAYRNRAQLKSQGQQLGFVAAASHSLVAVEQCLLLTPECAAQMQAVRAQLAPEPVKAKTPWLTWDINEREYRANSRLPFAQGNSAQNTYMRQWLREQLQGCERDQPLLELFAGSGNFTQVIAAAGFTSIHAVEVVAEAVAALNKQSLPGVTAQATDLFKDGVLNTLIKQVKPATVVLDPPRDGLKTIAQLQAKKTPIKTLLYISCDLATFARDAQMLIKEGFNLTLLQPVDMFPQTPHVELLARFARR
ncbi:MAG TPA: TRAM domain-containing protein [Cellvibrionaceae bacterium]|nr:TRAM domain-containing protein [Cellvibrionaceae bacterium]HMW48825.1 TRAM domain-containing protein [Cellvibrionaceae bacterium]HMY39085.1 TRAM domain-containing protein [Marinagarivorans sp.]HNG60012.1 TRAM domain-containing protein [Cellvibrionaceae bacterium]